MWEEVVGVVCGVCVWGGVWLFVLTIELLLELSLAANA